MLMAPVESLLDMVPVRLDMPYSGLQTRRLPGKGSVAEETEETSWAFSDNFYLVTVRGPLL